MFLLLIIRRVSTVMEILENSWNLKIQFIGSFGKVMELDFVLCRSDLMMLLYSFNDNVPMLV